MTNIPDPEPTPLRLRLGPRSDSFWQQPVESMPDIEALIPTETTHDVGTTSYEVVETMQFPEVAAPVPSEPTEAPAPAPWRERLDRAVAQNDQRVERWVADQQRRLVASLDLMLAQLKEQRQQEVARLEAWKITERQRVERELGEEESHFRARMMDELRAFEEQLGLRLIEQEERIARWWEEAERLAQQRFEALGLSPSGEATRPPAN